MNNKSLLAITIYNIVVLLVFLALSIIFKHWWIMLLSLFFIVSFPVTVRQCYRICDSCGVHSTYCDTPDKALERAIKDGWTHSDEGNLDYCPKCASKMAKED